MSPIPTLLRLLRVIVLNLNRRFLFAFLNEPPDFLESLITIPWLSCPCLSFIATLLPFYMPKCLRTATGKALPCPKTTKPNLLMPIMNSGRSSLLKKLG